mmetsp:Transcript_50371/g.129768  ORF Transcript_50371/g.129768 Transcript_50371/m.129768 type:complete len:232 (-) Transcript_50371:1298-1993(-)
MAPPAHEASESYSPNAYGHSYNSRNRSQPSFAFGSADRFGYVKARERRTVPGPGAYESNPALGAQKDSQRSTRPSYSFGNSIREKANNGECLFFPTVHLPCVLTVFDAVFISPQHEKVRFGTLSPGPRYSPRQNNSLGQQSLTENRSSSEYTFSKAGRFAWQLYVKKVSKDAIPGPGAYKNVPAVGAQLLSQRNTKPAFSFHGSLDYIPSSARVTAQNSKASTTASTSTAQ